jgi:hypothetical protein
MIMKYTLLLVVQILTISSYIEAQPEVFPWSNINGIRVDGELMELNGFFALVGPDWSTIRKTAKERARYQYRMDW